MPVPIEDRYKILFDHHRFVSEYRLSLLKMWGAVYLAMSGLFVWAQANVPWASSIVVVVTIFLTVFFWLADWRHRPAIGGLKDVGIAIEADAAAGIPVEQRYFSKLNKGVSHSLVIDVFTAFVLALLLFSAGFLFCCGSRLSKERPNKAPEPTTMSVTPRATE